jgi:cell filamentation protein, protein adenylyltransferase
LRNLTGEKDLAIVRRLEHSSFVTGLEPAFRDLGAAKTLAYDHVLSTHKTLFEAIYPWAGQDRLTNFPGHAVVKGEVQFAHPNDIRAAVDWALRNGQDRNFMTKKPGEVMGYLAYGHPFLDGNGRSIMVVHALLAHRAGFSIDWAETDKEAYLAALTKEIDAPGKGHLDAYLAAFRAPAIASGRLADAMAQVAGLAGEADGGENKVLGATNDPAVQARYEQHQLKRKQSQS